MKKTIEIMTTWEAVRKFIADEELRAEYMEECESFRSMDLKDDMSIQYFLDNDAMDVRRLNEVECELLCLEWHEGWYINTWNDSYIS